MIFNINPRLQLRATVCLPSRLNAAHVCASVKKHAAGDVLNADAADRDSGIGQGADIVLRLFPAFVPAFYSHRGINNTSVAPFCRFLVFSAS
jgi:hypothetical protein